MRYIIMERMPFPGYLTATATCWLQMAELETFKGDRFYHQRAVTRRTNDGRLHLYKWDDAQMLISTLKAQHPYAVYSVIGMIA